MSMSLSYADPTRTFYNCLGDLIVNAFHAWTEMAAYRSGVEHLGLQEVSRISRIGRKRSLRLEQIRLWTTSCSCLGATIA